MKHFIQRYSIQKRIPEYACPPDCCWSVIDHQGGVTVEDGLTWSEAHDTIDELTDVSTKPEADEYPELSDGWRHRSNVRSGMYGR